MKLSEIRLKVKNIFQWIFKPGERLSQKVVHAGVWVFTLRIINRLFGLTRTIVLARLLAPNDFGLFGIAILALSSLESFSKTGFDQALIQRKEETISYLDTAWTIQVLRGVILGIILFFAAPLVGTFFGEPRAVLIVRILGLAELIRGLRSVGIVYFRKDLEFHKQFIYKFSGTVADLAVALPAAFVLRSVWALVFGLLARNVVRSVFSYIVHSFRPSFVLDIDKARELIDFGRWIMGLSIVTFIATKGDDIFLGRVLGSTALGLYQLAFRISNLTATEIAKVISKVTFPAYSKIQENKDKLKKGFVNTLNVLINFTFPLTIVIILFSYSFVNLFLGEQWLPMVRSMQILALAGFIRSISATGVIFKSVGRPNLTFWMNLLRVLVIVGTIYPLTVNFGINGTAISVLLGIVVTLPFWFKYSTEITSFSLFELKSGIIPAFTSSLVFSILFWVMVSVLGSVSFVNFVLIAVLVLVSYLAIQWLFWRYYKWGLFNSVKLIRDQI